MTTKRTAIIGIAAIGATLGIALVARIVSANPNLIQGAVVTLDPDPTKELPISDVEVTLEGGLALGPAKSDASGFFTIPLRRRIRLGQNIVLRFRHPEYEMLELRGAAENKLYIAHLLPVPRPAESAAQRAEVKIDHIVARYSVNTTTSLNVGSAVKTFQVVNKANVLCMGQRPCSPDGKWKAAIGAETMDAGSGNEFHNARASCIAGPCPFTRIEENNFSRDSGTLRVSALNWSDTVTFLVEAEVYRRTTSDVLRRSYPVIFDRALTFTLPGSAEGVSIEAELDGSLIIFPLGPSLYLSWANCQLLVNKDQTKVYRCELKAGYRFP